MCSIALIVFVAAMAQAGRYEGYTQAVASGPKMELVAATYFGGDGMEEFVGVAPLPDGSLVALGNAWGPQFLAIPQTVVIGKGQHRGLAAYGPPDKKGNRAFRMDNPDRTGFFVIYDSQLKAIKRVVRLDWGLGSIVAGVLTPSGDGVVVTGTCTELFRNVPVTSPLKVVPSPRDKQSGPYTYEKVTCPGDVYLAKISLDGKMLWAWVFEGYRRAPDQLFVDKQGNTYGDFRGLMRFTPDGQTGTKIPTTDKDGKPKTYAGGGQTRYLGVNPEDGSFFFGGDRNTNTGHQPYRQPYFYIFDKDGRRGQTYWEFPPRQCACGGDGNGLCSDSAPRAMTFAPNGDYIISGWSDGGNSVLARQPTDVTKGVKGKGLGFQSYGMKSANSLAHIVRIDAKQHEAVDYCLWVSFVPDNFHDKRYRGAPNAIHISDLVVLGDGSLAFCGGSATGLIQTPNAFFKPPADGTKFGGEFVSVLNPTWKTLQFSSYLPGYANVSLAAVKDGLVLAGRSSGQGGSASSPAPTPVLNAIQKDKRGEFDGHIMILRLPPK
jgi:hypothetical protein